MQVTMDWLQQRTCRNLEFGHVSWKRGM